MTALLVVAGAMLGAPLRYLADLLVQSRHGTAFPWGTLTVNAVGSLILGAVAGAVSVGAPAWLLTLVGTGLSGALTTFSTFGYETVRLFQEDAAVEAVLNAAASLVLSLVACVGGWALTVALL